MALTPTLVAMANPFNPTLTIEELEQLLDDSRDPALDPANFIASISSSFLVSSPAPLASAPETMSVGALSTSWLSSPPGPITLPVQEVQLHVPMHLEDIFLTASNVSVASDDVPSGLQQHGTTTTSDDSDVDYSLQHSHDGNVDADEGEDGEEEEEDDEEESDGESEHDGSRSRKRAASSRKPASASEKKQRQRVANAAESESATEGATVELSTGASVFLSNQLMAARLQQFNTFVKAHARCEADKRALKRARRLYQGRQSSSKSREQRKMEMKSLAVAVHTQNSRLAEVMKLVQCQARAHFAGLQGGQERVAAFSSALEQQLRPFLWSGRSATDPLSPLQ